MRSWWSVHLPERRRNPFHTSPVTFEHQTQRGQVALLTWRGEDDTSGGNDSFSMERPVPIFLYTDATCPRRLGLESEPAWEFRHERALESARRALSGFRNGRGHCLIISLTWAPLLLGGVWPSWVWNTEHARQEKHFYWVHVPCVVFFVSFVLYKPIIIIIMHLFPIEK